MLSETTLRTLTGTGAIADALASRYQRASRTASCDSSESLAGGDPAGCCSMQLCVLSRWI